MSIAQYKDRNRAELWALAQIQAIEYESALRRIAELEKERDIHDLEQQAKGIEDALNDCTHSREATQVYVADLDERVVDLRNQARALEQSE